MLLKSIEVVATLTLIILLGCFLKHRNIITDKSSKLLASLAVFVAIPSMIFISIIDGYDKKSFIEIAPTILIPMANMIFLYFIALLISKLLRIPKKRIGIFISVITFSNVVLMGFPVASAVLGNESLKYGSIYFLGNTLVFWTLGIWLIKKDAKYINGENSVSEISNAQKIKEFLKNIFNPTIISFLIAIIFIFVNIKPPSFIYNSIKHISNLGTPLAMLYLGSIIYETSKMKFKYTYDIIILVAARFILAPLSMIIMLSFFNLKPLFNESFLLFSGMAAMNQLSVLAGLYSADKEYAAASVVSTLVLYPISLFLYSFFLTFL